MNANDNQYGALTPSPEEEQEKKKKKKTIKKVLVGGLVTLALLGGCSVGLGSCIKDRQPPPMPQETAAVVVDKREVAPTPTEYIMPVAPTPTDVREGWYGHYDGISTGVSYDQLPNEISTWEFEDYDLWLKIKKWEDCGGDGADFDAHSVCNEDLSWGVYTGNFGCMLGDLHLNYNEIRLYLPENLNDAPGLTITDDKLTITPTEEYPYEIVIEKINGQLEGYMVIDWDNPEHNPQEETPEKWVLDDFVAEKGTEIPPCQR